MGKLHDQTFPGESDEYREARDELLSEEIKLRARLESVAALRRKLPLGGKLKEDYIFEEASSKQVKFSSLFAPGKSSLIIYSFMYPEEDGTPCPLCTSILDGLNGSAPHILQQVNFVVVAKASIQKIVRFAQSRNWSNLRVLSSEKNTYNQDYGAQNPEWGQMPALNVFVKRPDGIYHFYNTELLYASTEEGQDTRHIDLIWPLWNMFDLTPEGRGTDWYPKLTYK